MDRAQQRIAWTLGVSALLHVWFIYTAQQPGAPRVTAVAAMPLTATLSERQINGLAPQPAPNLLPQSAPNPVTRLEPLVTNNAVAKVSERSSLSLASEPAVVIAERSTQQATTIADATYYTARDLDVFPKAITVLELGLRAGTTGKVRATVLIDESGTVNEVRAIDAGIAEIERAARDLLLRARFTPASKDGRVVKAQLLVSLDYGPPP